MPGTYQVLNKYLLNKIHLWWIQTEARLQNTLEGVLISIQFGCDWLII